MNEVADLLDDAADYIEKHGWCQGMFGQTRMCAIGAIRRVGKEPNTRISAVDALAQVVEVHPGVGGYRVSKPNATVFVWNDTPGRTQQEVLDAFRLAAKNERSRDEHPIQ